VQPVKKEEFWVDWCKEELAQGRSLKIPAHGFSMLPSINQGSIVQIEAISMEQILPGDLIAFQRLQHLVVHRVLKIKQKDTELLFESQGDSNMRIDERITSLNYIGKVTKKNNLKLSKKIPSYPQRIFFSLIALGLTYFFVLKNKLKKLRLRLNQQIK
jgi:signal peptidase I